MWNKLLHGVLWEHSFRYNRNEANGYFFFFSYTEQKTQKSRKRDPIEVGLPARPNCSGQCCWVVILHALRYWREGRHQHCPRAGYLSTQGKGGLPLRVSTQMSSLGCFFLVSEFKVQSGDFIRPDIPGLQNGNVLKHLHTIKGVGPSLGNGPLCVSATSLVSGFSHFKILHLI